MGLSIEGMELIRPMYMVREEDILKWKRYNELEFIQCACRFTENCVLGDSGGVSKRQEMKILIKKLRQTSPGIDMNIFNSAHNVNLNTVIEYRDDNGKHSFLDTIKINNRADLILLYGDINLHGYLIIRILHEIGEKYLSDLQWIPRQKYIFCNLIK